MMRTHAAGTLRAADAGSRVTLAGWVARRRDHGGVAFCDLRDASGVAQVVLREDGHPSAASPEDAVRELRPESCVLITGDVRIRPAGNENPEIASGEVEVVADDVRVLSESAALPFHLDAHSEAGEEARLRWRYLDLRRAGPARAIRMRSEANRVAREVMHEWNFVEVETPTLTRSTPEGARDFLVPCRLQPGSWYALPQSPQLFKQLLMVAGLERYFQIARCYRDEDFRADRQPEFTQLDIEMSFVDTDDVIEIGEAVIRELWERILGHRIGEIARLPFAEAMARYGSDKPDLRYGVELSDLTSYFADTPFRVFQAPYVGAVVMPGGASQPRRTFDAWQEWAKQRGARGLAYVSFAEDGELTGPVAKNLSEAERAGLREAVGARPGDCAFFAAGQPHAARSLLGAARDEIAQRLGLIKPGTWSFVWIVDAPMFEPAEEGNPDAGWTPLHHPFTSPSPEWIDRFDQQPGAALASAYDLICNGNEIGGGSIRIHRADLQRRVFSVLDISPEQADREFGFLLEAFKYGPPPHGGIAFGWDRICMLLAGANSLRDVIAFPKTGGGQDPLTGAPAPITPAQRAESFIDFTPEKPGAAGHARPE